MDSAVQTNKRTIEPCRCDERIHNESMQNETDNALYSIGMEQKTEAVNHQNSALLLRCFQHTHWFVVTRSHIHTESITERLTSHFGHSLEIFSLFCCAKPNLYNFEFIV